MFQIIATGYNCAEFVQKCYQSVLKQTEEWNLHLISDGSTDHTETELNKIRDERVSINIYKENKGAAFRRYQAIKPLNENNIIVLLDLDDELLPDALSEVKAQYKLGKWMTYGNWKDQWGEINKVPLYFDKKTHLERNYREVAYRSTACKTFYKFLFDNIPEEDFQLRGEWLQSATESELMFSVLEMCGREKIGIIEKPIYLYNRLLPNGSQKRLGQEYKNNIYNEICKRPKKELLRGLHESL